MHQLSESLRAEFVPVDQLLHKKIDVAFLENILGIAIIGAQKTLGRIDFIHDGCQRGKIFRDRAFADGKTHALGKFLKTLFGKNRLVAISNPAAKIGIECF